MMSELTQQDLIDLTAEQLRAWKKIEIAIQEFRRAGGRFYTVLDSIHGLNGKNIHTILLGDDGDIVTENICMPLINDCGFSGMADDTHSIYLTDKARAMLEGK